MEKKETTISNRDIKFSVSFKLSWEQHTLLQEIASKQGKNITVAARELLDRGMDAWFLADQTKVYSPTIKLAHALRVAHEREYVRAGLRELKWNTSPEEFEELCRINGETPQDYDAVPQPTGDRLKQEEAKRFLRILFADRPNGMPVKRVLALATQEGLGTNLVRDMAKVMGLIAEWEMQDGIRTSLWRLPE